MTTARISCFRDMIWGTSSRLPSPEAREGGHVTPPIPLVGVSSQLCDHFCLGCRRLLLSGELYSDGFRDGQVYCHSCLRDAHLAGYYALEETIQGREDTEEIR